MGEREVRGELEDELLEFLDGGSESTELLVDAFEDPTTGASRAAIEGLLEAWLERGWVQRERLGPHNGMELVADVQKRLARSPDWWWELTREDHLEAQRRVDAQDDV